MRICETCKAQFEEDSKSNLQWITWKSEPDDNCKLAQRVCLSLVGDKPCLLREVGELGDCDTVENKGRYGWKGLPQIGFFE